MVCMTTLETVLASHGSPLGRNNSYEGPETTLGWSNMRIGWMSGHCLHLISWNRYDSGRPEVSTQPIFFLIRLLDYYKERTFPSNRLFHHLNILSVHPTLSFIQDGFLLNSSGVWFSQGLSQRLVFILGRPLTSTCCAGAP